MSPIRKLQAVTAYSSQGQGSTTAHKERSIAAALMVSLSLAKKWPNYRYWHIDLNAGSGFNDSAQCIGSPLAFLDAAKDIGRTNFRALFCDINEDSIVQLQSRIGSDERCFCLPWNNSEVLPVVTKLIVAHERHPEYAWGTVVIDPNGYFGPGRRGAPPAIPIEELREFSRRFPRMDIVFNVNVRMYQLGASHIAKGEHSGWCEKFWPSPRDFPELFSRKHWLIRDVIAAKGHQFSLMVGRNYRAGDHATMGMRHFDSEAGRLILDSIDGQSTATANQFPPLQDVLGLFDAPDLQGSARRRDGASAVKVHSLREQGNRGSSQGVLPLGTV